MKLIERIYYGIIGKPVKSLLMMLVMFIIANLLSGSLILYNTTQTTLNSIKKQVAPVVIFEYPEKINLFSINRLNDEEYYEEVEKLLKAFNEVKKIFEVSYYDFSVFTNVTEEFLVEHRMNMNRDWDYWDFYTEVLFSNNVYPYPFKSNNYKMVEGRYFTDEEIEKGLPVIVVPDSYNVVKNGIRVPASIGDRIKISVPIIKDDSDCIGMTKEVCKSIYKNKIYKSLVYEAEIIGIYNKVESLKNFVFYDQFEIIVPLNFSNFVFNEYNKEFKLYEDKYQNEINEGKYSNLRKLKHIGYNYFELKDSEDIPVFLEKAKAIFEKYDLEGYKANVSNDSYLKVAGPLEALNSVSKTIIVSTIIISFIVLGLVSAMIIRDRKNEVGILLSLGESKKRIMIQFVCEMLLIGCLAIASSMITSKQFSKAMGDVIMNAYGETQEIDTTDQVILNDVTKQSVLDEYETELATSDTLLLSFFTSSVIVLTCSLSVLVVLKMKPKEILM